MEKAPLVYNRGPKMRPFFELAREAGVDVEAQLRKAGWCERTLLQPDVEMEREESVDLFRLIRDLCADPLLGLRAAARFDPEDVDILGLLVTQCEHALSAMEATARYAVLMGDAVVARVERTCGQVALSIGLSGGRTQLPEVVDYEAGAIRMLLARLSGDRCHPVEVWLARPQPARLRPWRDFFGAPVHFDAEVSTVVYLEPDTLIPFEGASRRLMHILAQRAAEAVQELPQSDDLIGRVRTVVDSALGGDEPSLAAVARNLGLSERTLRRRLRATGTSFRELLDDVRKQRALTLLHSADLSVGELAHRCGFRDGTTFARAFKRWTGVAPAEAIRSQRAQHS